MRLHKNFIYIHILECIFKRQILDKQDILDEKKMSRILFLLTFGLNLGSIVIADLPIPIQDPQVCLLPKGN